MSDECLAGETITFFIVTVRAAKSGDDKQLGATAVLTKTRIEATVITTPHCT